MENRGGSKSALFLMEQLLVILIFAICAAVCVDIFVSSYLLAKDSKDMNYALLAAESGAEAYKASDGNLQDVARLLGGVAEGPALRVYYDEEWQVCGPSQAAFLLELILQEGAADGPLLSDLSVQKPEGDQLIAFTVAARRTGP